MQGPLQRGFAVNLERWQGHNHTAKDVAIKKIVAALLASIWSSGSRMEYIPGPCMSGHKAHTCMYIHTYNALVYRE